MALRKTADRVDTDMRRYMREEGIQQTWPASERIVAAVGSDPEGSQIIRAAARLASALGGTWTAVHVEYPRGLLHDEAEEEQAQEHLRLAERLGGEAVSLQPSGLKISEDLLAFARSRNTTRIVVGSPSRSKWLARLAGSLAEELVRAAGDLHIQVVSREPKGKATRPSAAQPRAASPRWIGIAAVAVAFTTGLSFVLRSHLDLADLAMLYVLCIAVIAGRFGRAAAVTASLLSVAALDFFFVPPVFTFVVADFKHLGTFAIMLGVGFAIGDMAERIRSQARVAQSRERHTSTLFHLSAELAREGDPVRIQAAVLESVRERFQSEAVLLIEGRAGVLEAAAGSTAIGEEDRAVAQWSLKHRKSAGKGTDTLPGARGLWLPLTGAETPIGLLGVIPGKDRPPFAALERDLLEALCAQAALALERARMQSERGEALRRADREQLRNALLSSVSHDLRTPLGAITGAASSLLDPESAMGKEARQDLLLTIHEEAQRLHRLVSNLLDITRLESGTLQVKKEWVPLEEVVGSALSRLEEQLQGRDVHLELPDILIPVDPVLLEQVLVNLLENAAKYSPEGLPVEISALKEADTVTVTVSDQGPGIATGEEERIFEKLVRGSTPSARSGAGLGLAICRGIVQAHGGQISAGSRPQGGARFTFTLPSQGAPGPVPDEEIARG
jgi:two-component system sensor histidine kinase KdpD